MKFTYRATLGAFVAAFALAALTAASASATLPQFTPVSSSAIPFSGHSDGTVTFEDTRGDLWEYEGATIKGVIAPETGTLAGKVVKEVTVEFTKTEEFGCMNSYSTRSLVLTKLQGGLGYINEKNHEVGLALDSKFPYPSPGQGQGVWGRCKMYEASKEIKGALIIPFSPINTKEEVFDFALHQKDGEQEILEFQPFANIHNPLRLYSEGTNNYWDLGIEGHFTFETTEGITVSG